MTQTPKKSSSPQHTTPPRMTKRALSRHQRERARQRLVMIIVGSAIGLAVLAVVVGLVYEQLWVPSQPVAAVNTTRLSRGAYYQERRNELARSIAQNLQFQKVFGAQLGQFAQQIQSQMSTAEGQVASIKQSPVDQPTVDGWVDRELIAQGAASLGLTASNDDVAQKLVSELGQVFIPPVESPLTGTATLSPTAAIEPTAAPTSAPTATASAGVTATAVLTPTSGPTATPAPTNTAVPTPLVEVAVKQLDPVIQQVFDSYTIEMQNIDGTVKPKLTFNDFKLGLLDQYRRQLLTDKVQEQLIPEASFTPNNDPSGIETRQILLKVTVPISATDAEREAAFAARKADAEAVLAQVKQGTDFATLAKEKSEDLTTRENGGTLPSFDKTGKNSNNQQVDPAFLQAVLALQDGQTSDLVQTPFGWHIIERVKTTIPSKEDQLRDARSKAFDEWLKKQRAAATIQHFPPTTETPTELPAPTGTAVPLPTAPLGGEPTAVPTPTEAAAPTAVEPAAPTPTP